MNLQPHSCLAATAAEMEMLGEAASRSARAGLTIGLIGGLGAGKTHWTKGFVAGLGFQGEVTSPTFSLVHEYVAPQVSVFHFDFYRLKSATELLALGWDEYLEAGGIVIAEWAERFPELMPHDTVSLHLEVLGNQSSRRVTQLPRLER